MAHLSQSLHIFFFYNTNSFGVMLLNLLSAILQLLAPVFAQVAAEQQQFHTRLTPQLRLSCFLFIIQAKRNQI